MRMIFRRAGKNLRQSVVAIVTILAQNTANVPKSVSFRGGGENGDQYRVLARAVIYTVRTRVRRRFQSVACCVTLTAASRFPLLPCHAALKTVVDVEVPRRHHFIGQCDYK